jgi:dipeptidyl-peptidase-4
VTDSFPRQYARTQRLTLGDPRDLTVDPDGSQVVFARSRGGADPVNCLWVASVATGEERLLVDPAALLADIAADDADLPPEERARRERMREGAGGITSYATDRDVARICFALAGQLFVTGMDGNAQHVDVPGPVFDPRLSPDGQRIAYVRGRELWLADLAGGARLLAAEDDDTVSWGSADFVAAEEMRRLRGFWWSPDGTAIAACRVDDAPVTTWYIADAATPGQPPRPVRYPAAGTANPDVTLHLVPVGADEAAAGTPIEIAWDRAAFPYLAVVSWTDHGLALTVQSRDQRRLQVRTADVGTGATELLVEDSDDDWVELVAGTGRLIAPDTAVTCADRDGARRLVIGGEPVTPTDVQVRSIVTAEPDRVVMTANPVADATVLHVATWSSTDGFAWYTGDDGVHAAAVGGPTIIVRSADLEQPGGRWVLPSGHRLASHAERPLVTPRVHLVRHTEELPATAVLLPHHHAGEMLPVLLDPYGGPHAQRVLRSHNALCASQWFAEQGFAVVVADGRGTPGRGTAYERAVRDDLATGVLEDQIRALHAAADRYPELDLDRVAIRGWSFGGYLAALAVLQRPDVFHAAVAGAPVTEWRLYDTHYTERYLGDPNEQPEVYDRSSLLPLADRLERPLLLIHGLADDNVVAAHSLRLSAALLAAGKPHEVLPLVGVSHMTPQEVVAENLLLHQLDFLRRSLAR